MYTSFMTVLKLWVNPAHREQYDLVTARAVARMSVLSELCLPLVKVGGHFIAMKAAHANDELAVGQKGYHDNGRKNGTNIYFHITDGRK